MDTSKCGSCSELLSDGVRCAACNQILHYHCAGVTEAGYRKLGDRKLTWRCGKCKNVKTLDPRHGHPGGPRPASPVLESNTVSSILTEIKVLADRFTPLESLKDEFKALREEFQSLKTSVNETRDVLKEFRDKMNNMEHRILQVEKAQEQVTDLRARLDKLEQDSKDHDQWSRMNNVEIKGVKQKKNENLFDILQAIGSKIQYPVNKSLINFITRVPTRESDQEKPIIVCFNNRYVKEDFAAAARASAKTAVLTAGHLGLEGNQKIYINDHLTTHNKVLLGKAKKIATEKGFRYKWVKHSKIYLRKDETSHIICIKTEKDLTKIV